jgi:hypothetical protein
MGDGEASRSILLMLLSPLGERLGEGLQATFTAPSPNLSPKGERK